MGILALAYPPPTIAINSAETNPIRVLRIKRNTAVHGRSFGHPCTTGRHLNRCTRVPR